MVIEMVRNGLPERKKQLPLQIKPYWSVRQELSTNDGMLFQGQRVVEPRQDLSEEERKTRTERRVKVAPYRL